MSHPPTPTRYPTLLPDWHPYTTLLIGWPIRRDTWRESAVPAQNALIQFISSILSHTSKAHICVLVDDSTAAIATFHASLNTSGLSASLRIRISTLLVPMDDCWIRDTGPILLTDDSAACFRFNAWGGANGGCYAHFEKDAKVSMNLCKHLDLHAITSATVMEGGAISGDGEGTVLATKEAVLNGNRNGGKSQEEIEAEMKQILGISKVIWLDQGAAFDTDTNGHVDNMARFVGPGHVLLLWADEDSCADQARRSRMALEALAESRDAQGRKLRVSTVSWGGALVRSAKEAEGVELTKEAKGRKVGEKLCASYVNYVEIENVVFVPSFGRKDADENAAIELKHVFKEYGKKIVQVRTRELVLSGGGIHCLTLGVK